MATQAGTGSAKTPPSIPQPSAVNGEKLQNKHGAPFPTYRCIFSGWREFTDPDADHLPNCAPARQDGLSNRVRCSAASMSTILRRFLPPRWTGPIPQRFITFATTCQPRLRTLSVMPRPFLTCHHRRKFRSSRPRCRLWHAVSMPKANG